MRRRKPEADPRHAIVPIAPQDRAAKKRPDRETRLNANKTSGQPARPGLSPSAIAAIAVTAVLIGVGVWIAATPARRPAALVGGPFTLETAGGKRVTDVDLAGHPFLVYFGYTHCPDVCPTTLAQIADVLHKMPDTPIRVLFVTVDPERDSPAAMADYVSSFDPRFVGLSGTPEEIAAVEKGYRVYAHKGPAQSDGGYTMDHSSVVYLMDKRGAFVESLDLERPAEDTAKELAAYL
jgi:protein SCO1/2